MGPVPDVREYFSSLAEVRLQNNECFILESADGQKYDINLSLLSSRATRVMIILDADLIGALSIEMARNLFLGYEIEDVAIVTIGFRAQTYGDLHSRRALNYCFETIDLSNIAAEQTGGGENFLKFLTDVLEPELVSRLPSLVTKPSLTGYSLSGLFVLGAIIRSQCHFSNFHVISPSLWIDGERTSDELQQFYPDAPLNLGIFAGGLEHVEDEISKYVDMIGRILALQSKLQSIPNWNVKTSIIEYETHQSVPAPAIARILRNEFCQNQFE